MSVVARKTFNNLIFINDIKIDENIINYFNGKAQLVFYNEYFEKLFQNKPSKTPFKDNDFVVDSGKQITEPIIYLNNGKNLVQNYNIAITNNAHNKTFFIGKCFDNPLDKIDKATAQTKLYINCSRTTEVNNEIEPEDKKFNFVHFILSDANIILLLCDIFSINLKEFNEENNESLYKFVIDKMNEVIDEPEHLIQMPDSEQFKHYNIDDIIYNIDIETDNNVLVPCYLNEDGEEIKIYTMLNIVLEYYLVNKFNGIGKKRVENKKLTEARFITDKRKNELLKALFKLKLSNPSTMIKYFTPKQNEDEQNEEQKQYKTFQFKGTFTFAGKKASDIQRKFCSQMIKNNDGKKEWETLDLTKNYTEFETNYLKNVSNGILYIKPSFRFTVFKETSINLNIMVNKIDLEKHEKEEY